MDDSVLMKLLAGAATSACSRLGFDLIVASITIYRTVGIIRLPGRLENLKDGSTLALILGNGM
jgi:hypothetical protein